MAYDFRKDFPLLQQNKIAYLDNAATAQRPQCVIDAESSAWKPRKFMKTPGSPFGIS